MQKEFRVDNLFQDNMVLQREKPLNIWGEGPEGEDVSLFIQGKEGRTTVVEGKWMITLSPLETSLDEEMVIRCGGEEIRLAGILVGEVWLAGGQSNMEFFIRYDEEKETLLREGENPLLRFYDIPRISYDGQEKEADYSLYGFWRVCDRENLEYFSAVGYYFSSLLNRDLNVPVGIIGCNWGGSPSCTWMDRACLRDEPLKIWFDNYENGLKSLDMKSYEKKFKGKMENYRNDLFADEIGERLMFGMSDEEMEEFMASPDYTDQFPSPGPLDPHRPGGLFEHMLMRAVPFTLRGFIWYQGESDDKAPAIYDLMLTRLISCWRDAWKEELPFLYVQLAPFRKWLHCRGKEYPLLREKQRIVSHTVPRVWMASIMDAGMEKDIHPKRKRPAGERLALLAEGHVYGKDILCDSPEFNRAEIGEDRVVLHFDHAPGGMDIRGNSASCLELILQGEPVLPERILAGDSRLTLFAAGIGKAGRGEIRFAWKDYCEVNLYNRAGLPLKPFLFSWGEE